MLFLRVLFLLCFFGLGRVGGWDLVDGGRWVLFFWRLVFRWVVLRCAYFSRDPGSAPPHAQAAHPGSSSLASWMHTYFSLSRPFAFVDCGASNCSSRSRAAGLFSRHHRSRTPRGAVAPPLLASVSRNPPCSRPPVARVFVRPPNPLTRRLPVRRTGVLVRMYAHQHRQSINARPPNPSGGLGGSGGGQRACMHVCKFAGDTV